MVHGHRLALTATLVFAAASLGVVAVEATRPDADDPYVVEIRIRYSRFEPSTVSVPAGQPVIFVLRNEDPIEHEWIVGDELVHEVHRTGTEEHHASRPTEISIPPLSTRRTTITFARPLAWQFICHLPGHEAYGMLGLVTAR